MGVFNQFSGLDPTVKKLIKCFNVFILKLEQFRYKNCCRNYYYNIIHRTDDCSNHKEFIASSFADILSITQLSLPGIWFFQFRQTIFFTPTESFVLKLKLFMFNRLNTWKPQTIRLYSSVWYKVYLQVIVIDRFITYVTHLLFLSEHWCRIRTLVA